EARGGARSRPSRRAARAAAGGRRARPSRAALWASRSTRWGNPTVDGTLRGLAHKPAESPSHRDGGLRLRKGGDSIARTNPEESGAFPEGKIVRTDGCFVRKNPETRCWNVRKRC